jgi:hypothetical protein
VNVVAAQLNARRGAAVPLDLNFIKTVPADGRISGSDHRKETGMTNRSIGGSAVSHVLAMLAVVGAQSSQALASQGPGTSAGAASATTQTGMAFLVYGLSAAVVIAGLVGALRQRRRHG